MKIKTQFTLYLKNEAGELSKITRKLASADINIEGISVSATTDVGLVQVVVSAAAKTRTLLKTDRIPFTEQKVVLAPLRNEPGALSHIVTRISKAGININYVYATACMCGSDCRCYAVISAPNLEKLVGLGDG